MNLLDEARREAIEDYDDGYLYGEQPERDLDELIGDDDE